MGPNNIHSFVSTGSNHGTSFETFGRSTRRSPHNYCVLIQNLQITS